MADLIVENLSRTYGGFTALKGMSLRVKRGEFLTLLGPSGCGKSTALWLLAGLDRPDAGRIALGDYVMADISRGVFVPAEDRNIGLVFQSYALWPHMTVRQNVEFPLRLRSIGRRERTERVEQMLNLVELHGQADKYPHALSGGQQQRVALARTLVFEPEVLLLDEPLSNLDAKLRERARIWLRKLHDRMNIATIFVTHDQDEALAMSDRIVVMNKGEIVQSGSPEELYRSPASPFVADFIGTANLFDGVAEAVNGAYARIRLSEAVVIEALAPHALAAGQAVKISVRPELIDVTSRGGMPVSATQGTTMDAEVVSSTFQGAHYHLEATSKGLPIRLQVPNKLDSENITISIKRDHWRIYA
ncbi:Fe(3+) ions import ATP-binding protein FbpC [Hyphomicrobiales bacterium]|nr:Fe(3+) ions import ATP-binding protein FbpC [Hyphomicrobiales bacterium]CAH1693487.1 Fe(3+) ions import ATP-binding protein FbpC [Hyphomicrobiales bacterium]